MNGAIFPRRVGDPEVGSAVAFVEPGLHLGVVDAGDLGDTCGLEKSGEKIFRFGTVVQIIACAGEGSNEQCAAAPECMFNGGSFAVLVLANRISALEHVFLAKVASENFRASDVKYELVLDIGDELDIALARAEDLVEAVVGLHGANVSVIAEIAGKAFTNQGPALVDV